MKTFLEYVATDIIGRYGTDLSRMAIVFPNRRAALFLNEALDREAECPLWSPKSMTISELFRQHSKVLVADPIKLVCDLHSVYTEVTGFDETLDRFYGWGQLLVADFDDVDKNMVDARQLFANLSGIHELDDVSYLSDEQKEIIRKFFQNFSDDHQSLLKERFLRLWSRMGDIYNAFNERLTAQGLAYEGALYRDVAEDGQLTFDYDHYLFVGFNLLQQVEQRLFTMLKRQGKAHFYWDYDIAYRNSEAGYYISQYLDRFPNELSKDRLDIFDNYSKPKNITFASASTENIQARYVSTWLRDRAKETNGANVRTAIVLCDEALLLPVIHCLPDETPLVNITAGYPLKQTPIASLIELLINLQTIGRQRQNDRFRLHQVLDVLNHPYGSYLSDKAGALAKQLSTEHIYYPDRQMLSVDEGLSLIFGADVDDNKQLLSWLTSVVERLGIEVRGKKNEGPLQEESLFRMFTLLNRLTSLVESDDLHVDTVTLQRLILQLVQQTTIPFHGEPAVGIQVMGVLETRNLDFDHVLMLSANEGNMPRGINDASFIPYSLRKAFGMTTADHKVAIYAYYFNRLLSRAKDVTLVYNNATSDGHTGEMSRFMLQMLVESPHPIRQIRLKAEQQLTPRQRTSIEKDDKVIAILKRRFDRALNTNPDSQSSIQDAPLLTPTAINRYMRCQLQFYYHYVEGLREPDDQDNDTIDNRIFGNIFHDAAQLLYERQKSSHITATDIDQLLKNRVDIERAVDDAFRHELFHIQDDTRHFHPQLNGLQIISREAVIHYLRQLLQIDRRLAPFDILDLEADVIDELPITTLGITTTIGGRIDRLDCISSDNAEGGRRIRVIDYKTGSRRLKSLKSVDDVFDAAQLQNHNDYYLQTLLYSRIVRRTSKHPVAPALLFIQHAQGDDYDPVLKFGNEKILDVATPDGDRFVTLLMEKVNEIFNPQLDFVPTSNADVCRTCPYTLICGLRTK